MFDVKLNNLLQTCHFKRKFSRLNVKPNRQIHYKVSVKRGVKNIFSVSKPIRNAVTLPGHMLHLDGPIALK